MYFDDNHYDESKMRTHREFFHKQNLKTSTHNLCFGSKICIPLYPSTTIWAAPWENRIFAYVKTKAQTSFAETVKLISAFDFATRMVQSLVFLNPKCQASSLLLRRYRPVCVRPGRKPRRPVFLRDGSYKKVEYKGVYNIWNMLSWWKYLILHTLFLHNIHFVVLFFLP